MRDTIFETVDRLGINRLFNMLTKRKLRILCYHGLWTSELPPYGNKVFMPTVQFKARMKHLKDSGIPVISLNDAVDALKTDSLPDAATVITIDDGWASSYTHMLPILEEFHLSATLYITTWHVGKSFPVLNKAIDYIATVSNLDKSFVQNRLGEMESLPESDRDNAIREFSLHNKVPLDWWHSRQFHFMTDAEIFDARIRGLDIQLHSHRHKDFSIFTDHLASDIADNRKALANACKLNETLFNHFCYPSGYYSPDDYHHLYSAGVKSATLVEEGLNSIGTDPYRLRRFLDGRLTSQLEFNSYLSGSRDFIQLLAKLLKPSLSSR